MKYRKSLGHIITVVIVILMVASCNGKDTRKTIFLGVPKEFFELNGPVKRVTFLSEKKKEKEEDEWEPYNRSNIPYTVMFNEEGYLTIWGSEELNDEGVPIRGSIRKYNEDGTPASYQEYNQKENKTFSVPFEAVTVKEKQWYIYTKKNEVDSGFNWWRVWNRKKMDDDIVVKRAFIQGATQENIISDIEDNDFFNEIVIFYRNDHTIRLIKTIGGNELYFNEEGKWVKTINPERDGTYSVLSETAAEYRYSSLGGTQVIRYNFELDKYGNWTTKIKYSSHTSDDVVYLTKITREIEYYEKTSK